MVGEEDFEKKTLDLYKQYLQGCVDSNTTPVSLPDFTDWVKEMAARMTAHEIAQGTMDSVAAGEEAIYVSVRLKDIKKPTTNYELRKCDQCREDVVVDPSMVELIEHSKAVICNVCIPEVTNQGYEDIIGNALDSLNNG